MLEAAQRMVFGMGRGRALCRSVGHQPDRNLPVLPGTAGLRGCCRMNLSNDPSGDRLRRSVGGTRLNRHLDIAIVGSGFAGSLAGHDRAATGPLRRSHRAWDHPRVVIGESSTPLSNLLLEELTERYDLRRCVRSRSGGSWQSAFPTSPVD